LARSLSRGRSAIAALVQHEEIQQDVKEMASTISTRLEEEHRKATPLATRLQQMETARLRHVGTIEKAKEEIQKQEARISEAETKIAALDADLKEVEEQEKARLAAEGIQKEVAEKLAAEKKQAEEKEEKEKAEKLAAGKKQEEEKPREARGTPQDAASVPTPPSQPTTPKPQQRQPQADPQLLRMEEMMQRMMQQMATQQSAIASLSTNLQKTSHDTKALQDRVSGLVAHTTTEESNTSGTPQRPVKKKGRQGVPTAAEELDSDCEMGEVKRPATLAAEQRAERAKAAAVSESSSPTSPQSSSSLAASAAFAASPERMTASQAAASPVGETPFQAAADEHL
jgi:DNA repair exonuclease SbcCD ATPase subunit